MTSLSPPPSSSSSPGFHVEPHIRESNYIRDVVFGFGDGVNTSLGIVAGVGGADVAANIVILSALVGMFTGAKAMAVQNYLQSNHRGRFCNQKSSVNSTR